MRDPARQVIVSLVERGWQGARECSLDPSLSDRDMVHVIKGLVPRPVIDMIVTTPSTQLACAPKWLFWLLVWALLPGLWLTGRLQAVLVDNDRSYRRLRGWQWAGVVVAKALPGQTVRVS